MKTVAKRSEHVRRYTWVDWVFLTAISALVAFLLFLITLLPSAWREHQRRVAACHLHRMEYVSGKYFEACVDKDGRLWDPRRLR